MVMFGEGKTFNHSLFYFSLAYRRKRLIEIQSCVFLPVESSWIGEIIFHSQSGTFHICQVLYGLILR